MDVELMDSIRLFSKKKNAIKELDVERSRDLLGFFSEVFVSDSGRRWWWEALRCDAKTIEYGDDDGLEIIKKILTGVDSVFFVVTDDEFPPWSVFKGRLDDVLELISEQRYFEYFLFREGMDWCVFDTHHNSLVVAGVLNQNLDFA